MSECFNPLNRPDFFAIDGDCDNVNHDFRVVSGDISQSTSDIISAILIQLNTDGFENGERGFWGDEFSLFPIGNKLWTISGSQAAVGVTARADQMIREAMEPLIDQGLIDDLSVVVTRTIDGIEAEVKAFQGGNDIFGIVFNG